ncbi:hypothetical protein BJ508DRAFT_334757 [Ascobolus immersus RN42]|uniref:Uncharacterized protein n=1 Tax=Ascobolus immersus RN42 TaxID=1160509 RepID=A0A3N4HLP0_ASCIM|nr:hypothetical protein BJ508DRAFT_334757 [Ascobolus immersus RN42]
MRKNNVENRPDAVRDVMYLEGRSVTVVSFNRLVIIVTKPVTHRFDVTNNSEFGSIHTGTHGFHSTQQPNQFTSKYQRPYRSTNMLPYAESHGSSGSSQIIEWEHEVESSAATTVGSDMDMGQEQDVWMGEEEEGEEASTEIADSQSESNFQHPPSLNPVTPPSSPPVSHNFMTTDQLELQSVMSDPLVQSQLEAEMGCRNANPHSGTIILRAHQLPPALPPTSLPPDTIMPYIGQPIRLINESELSGNNESNKIAALEWDVWAEGYRWVGDGIASGQRASLAVLAMDHHIRGEVLDTMEVGDGCVVFAVAYEASSRCGPFV